MKNFFLSLSLLLTVAVSTAFANEKNNPGVLEVFKQEFAGAQNVSWSWQEGYQKATFVLGGHRAIAFFTEANEFAGCMRDLFFDQLPISVMKAVDNRFAAADFQEVTEITNSNGTSYQLIAEMNNRKYKIKVNASGDITEVEKNQNK